MGRIPQGKSLYKKGLLRYDGSTSGTATRDVHKPQAVYKNGYIYFTWVDYQGDIYVTKINENYEFGDANLVATRALDYNNASSDADHSVPTICIDNNGYLYIFYGCHNTQMYYRKSTNPYDVRSWSNRLSVTGATEASYPHPLVQEDGKILVVFRSPNASNKSLCIISTSNGGSSWSGITTIFTPNPGSHWSYPMGVAMGNESPVKSIHIIISLRTDGTSTFTHSYHVKSLDGGTTWKTSEGTTLSLPAKQADFTTNIESTGAYPGDIKINSSGVPYVCYTRWSDNATVFAKWNGTGWTKTVVANVATTSLEHSELDIISDSTIDVYTVAGTTTRPGGNMQRYRSTNSGSSFSLADQITKNALSTFRYHFPKVIKDHASNGASMIYIGGFENASYSFVNNNFKFYIYNPNSATTYNIIDNDKNRISSNKKATIFNGTSTVLFGGNANNISSNLSIAVWLWIDSSSAGTARTIVSKQDSWGVNTMVYHFNINSSNSFYLGRSGAAATFSSYGNNYPKNKWFHVVVTRSASNCKLYINKILVDTQSTFSLGTGYTSLFAIGAARSTPVEFFKGRMYDLQIFNTELLLPDIVNIYDYAITPSNCVQSYDLDGSTVDKSGNGNSLTIQNATYATFGSRNATSNRQLASNRQAA